MQRQIDFGSGLQDQVLRDQQIIFALKPRRDFALVADEQRGVDFKEKSWTIRGEEKVTVDGKEQVKPAIKLNYGAFINNVITFVIVAWAGFLLVKAMNAAETRLRLGQEPPAVAPPPPEDIVLLREIRDALKQRPAP